MELANLFTDLKFGKWLIFISKFTKWLMEFFEWIILSILAECRIKHVLRHMTQKTMWWIKISFIPELTDVGSERSPFTKSG